MDNGEQIEMMDISAKLTSILTELHALKEEVCELSKSMPGKPIARHPIGIDEVCKILGKAKPTVYALACKRLIPCYKSGKKLYFYEDEILAWIEQGRRSTMEEIKAKALKKW